MSPKTRFMLQAHRKVISYIHLMPSGRFSVKEAEGCGVSNSSVARTLKRLVYLELLKHYPTGYAGRHYELTSKWNRSDVKKVIEMFETAKLLQL